MKEFFTKLVLDKPFIVHVQPYSDMVMASSALEESFAILLVAELPEKCFNHVRSVLVRECPGVKKVKVKNSVE